MVAMAAASAGSSAPWVQKYPFAAVAHATELHQVAAPDQRRQGKAIGDCPAKGSKVRSHTVDRLSSAHMPAKAGDHLVQDEYRPVFAAQRLDTLQEIIDGLFGARRFHDDARDLTRIQREQVLQAAQIVVVEFDRQLAHHRRHSAGHVGRPDEPVVGGEEWMLGADGDAIQAGVRTRQAHGAVQCIGSMLAKFDHLRPLNDRQQLFSALDLESSGAGVIGAERQAALHGRHHRWVGMAEGDRAQAHAVLDEFITVHVADAAAIAALDDAGQVFRILVGPLGVGMAASRNQSLSTLIEAAAFIKSLLAFAHGACVLIGGRYFAS
jgi:hypothetical protein